MRQQGEALGGNCLSCRHEVGDTPNPANVRAAASFLNVLRGKHPPGEKGEIDTGARAESVPAPNARVYIEQLDGTVALIALELQFDQAGDTDALQQPAGETLDFRFNSRLDIGASVS